MSNFLNDITIPYFQAQTANDINFVLYDCQRKVLLASNNVLLRLNTSAKEIYGKTFEDFAHIKLELIPQLKRIFSQTLTNKKTTNFISIGEQINSKYKNHHELIFQSYEPIFDDKQQVIAVLARKIPTLKQNLFNIFFPQFQISSKLTNLSTEKLTPREFEIVYLLSNGLSQYEIATDLGISRSTVLKTITQRILEKLCLNENSSLEIIKTAILLGFHSKLPKSLIKEQLLIIEDN